VALDAEPRSPDQNETLSAAQGAPRPANDCGPFSRRAPKAAPADKALEETVARADQDRWLASRFAPKPARSRLVGLYAFNLELAQVGERVSHPRLGEIRLQWWRDAVEAVFRGEPGQHDNPTLRALAEAISAAHLPLAPFDALLTARVFDLAPMPFETWGDLDAYVDATVGGVMRLGVQICAPSIEFNPLQMSAIQAASRAWGYAGLVRALPAWIAQQRMFFPRSLRANVGLGDSYVGGEAEEAAIAFAAHAVLDRAIGAQKTIPRYVKALPHEAFPAIGYAALTPLYLRAYGEKEIGKAALREPSLFMRQLRLVLAAATGGF
jgi:phytoene synthase